MAGAHCRPIATRGHLVALAGGVARPALATLVSALLLAGCTGPSQPSNIFGGLLGPPPVETTAAPQHGAVASARTPPPARGSCGSAAECKVVLKSMIESPDRGWIGHAQAPDAYVNGTRLFAYRALRKQLTCSELGLAVEELQSVSRSLGEERAAMSPDQASRTRMLSSQVEGELAKERETRCRT